MVRAAIEKKLTSKLVKRIGSRLFETSQLIKLKKRPGHCLKHELVAYF